MFFLRSLFEIYSHFSIRARLGMMSGWFLAVLILAITYILWSSYAAFDAIEHVSVGANNAQADIIALVEEARDKLWNVTVVIAVIVLISVFMTFVIIWSVVPPIMRVVEAMHSLAQGDANVTVPEGFGKEIGKLCDAFVVFQEQKQAAEQAAEKERQELEMKAQRTLQMQQLISEFAASTEQAISLFMERADKLNHTAAEMAKTSDSASGFSTDVAENANVMSENVQSVASATQQLLNSFSEVNQQLSLTNESVNNVVNRASNADQTIESLSTATEKIGEVVSMIREIAEQINLLSLNATIESARAGEAGKGFAVVAGEIKNLATQTSNATTEISSLVEDVQSVGYEVVKTLNDIRDGIDEVNSYTAGISSAVEQQNHTTHEITGSMQQAALGVQNMTGSVDGMASGTAQVNQSSHHLLEVANDVSDQANKLQSDVKGFLGNIQNMG